MAWSVDDDSFRANARAWDFAMPPKSCWTVPLSSENRCVTQVAVTVVAFYERDFGVMAAVSAAEARRVVRFVGGHSPPLQWLAIAA